jgi:low temperature requirement protein LtrA
MEQALLSLAEKHGFTALLVAFFVWWSWIREKRLTERLDKVQDEMSGRVMAIIMGNTDAMRSLKEALEERPCMMQDHR